MSKNKANPKYILKHPSHARDLELYQPVSKERLVTYFGSEEALEEMIKINLIEEDYGHDQDKPSVTESSSESSRKAVGDKS